MSDCTANAMKKLEAKFDEAFAKPGELIPVGRLVVCDDCFGDYTDKPDPGGLIFCDKAICPACESKWVASAKRYLEERFIRAWCPAGVSFAEFVRGYRGPNAGIRVTTFGAV